MVLCLLYSGEPPKRAESPPILPPLGRGCCTKAVMTGGLFFTVPWIITSFGYFSPVRLGCGEEQLEWSVV
jgi:hypothetical protein